MKLRQLEEAAQPAHDVAAPMSAEDRQRALDLLHRAEALVDDGRSRRSRRPRWRRCGWPGPSCRPTSRSTRRSRSSSRRRARPCAKRLPSASRSARPRRSAPRALAREQADRLAIVTEIEQLAGPEALDRIAELKVQWDALPPMPSEYAASLNRRFQDACRAFEDRERRRMLAEAAAGRLETLATELEQLVASDQPRRGSGRALARTAARRRRPARARAGEPGGGRAARARGRGARGEGAAASAARVRSRSRTTCAGCSSCAARSRRWPPASRSR